MLCFEFKFLFSFPLPLAKACSKLVWVCISSYCLIIVETFLPVNGDYTEQRSYNVEKKNAFFIDASFLFVLWSLIH